MFLSLAVLYLNLVSFCLMNFHSSFRMSLHVLGNFLSC
jgi:hypothetical protein